MLGNIKDSKYVVGAKQTMRALKEGIVATVYLAADVEDKVSLPIIQLCQKQGVPIVAAPTMKEFGEFLEIEVSAAIAATLL